MHFYKKKDKRCKFHKLNVTAPIFCTPWCPALYIGVSTNFFTSQYLQVTILSPDKLKLNFESVMVGYLFNLTGFNSQTFLVYEETGHPTYTDNSTHLKADKLKSV